MATNTTIPIPNFPKFILPSTTNHQNPDPNPNPPFQLPNFNSLNLNSDSSSKTDQNKTLTSSTSVPNFNPFPLPKFNFQLTPLSNPNANTNTNTNISPISVPNFNFLPPKIPDFKFEIPIPIPKPDQSSSSQSSITPHLSPGFQTPKFEIPKLTFEVPIFSQPPPTIHYNHNHNSNSNFKSNSDTSQSHDLIDVKSNPPPSIPSRKSENAWVFLVMKGDSYLPGAITGAFSLKNTKTKYDIVCMVTSDVSPTARQQLKIIFDLIIEIPYIKVKAKNLKSGKQQKMYQQWIYESPTKWNMLSLQKYGYSKVMFVDADKIILQNIDHLFDLKAPAGTFSNPWAFPYEKSGMWNPYFKVPHGGKITLKMINEGLNHQNSFVAIGTMILLETNQQYYEEFVKVMEDQQSFGFPNCNSMIDEQSLVWFYYNKKIEWTMISQEYNFIPWKRKWLDRKKNEIPKVLHFFNTKPWDQPREGWTDLDPWWQLSEIMLKDNKYSSLKIIYPQGQLELKVNPGCFYCKLYDLRNPGYLSHRVFDENGNIECPYLKTK